MFSITNKTLLCALCIYSFVTQCFTEDVYVNEGENVKLNCGSLGQGTTWAYDLGLNINIFTNNDNGNLKILDASTGNTGIYECHNPNGQTKIFKVIVIQDPELRFTSKVQLNVDDCSEEIQEEIQNQMFLALCPTWSSCMRFFWRVSCSENGPQKPEIVIALYQIPELFGGSWEKLVEHSKTRLDKAVDKLNSRPFVVATNLGDKFRENMNYDNLLQLCNPGYTLQTGKCLPCEPGYYKNEFEGPCKSCPPNSGFEQTFFASVSNVTCGEEIPVPPTLPNVTNTQELNVDNVPGLHGEDESDGDRLLAKPNLNETAVQATTNRGKRDGAELNQQNTMSESNGVEQPQQNTMSGSNGVEQSQQNTMSGSNGVEQSQQGTMSGSNGVAQPQQSTMSGSNGVVPQQSNMFESNGVAQPQQSTSHPSHNVADENHFKKHEHEVFKSSVRLNLDQCTVKIRDFVKEKIYLALCEDTCDNFFWKVKCILTQSRQPEMLINFYQDAKWYDFSNSLEEKVEYYSLDLEYAAYKLNERNMGVVRKLGDKMVQNMNYNSTIYICGMGYHLNANKCVPCEPGYYNDEFDGQCKLCPSGSNFDPEARGSTSIDSCGDKLLQPTRQQTGVTQAPKAQVVAGENFAEATLSDKIEMDADKTAQFNDIPYVNNKEIDIDTATVPEQPTEQQVDIIGVETPETNSDGKAAVPNEPTETGENVTFLETAAAGQPEEGIGTESPDTNNDGTVAVPKEEGISAADMAAETGTNITIPEPAAAGQPEQGNIIGAEAPGTNSDGKAAVPNEATETGANVTFLETAAAGQPEEGIGTESPDTNNNRTVVVPKEEGTSAADMAAEIGTNITIPEPAAAGQPEQGNIIGAEAPGTNSDGKAAVPNEATETGANVTFLETAAAGQPEEGIGTESPDTNNDGTVAVPQEEGISAADMAAETGTNITIPAPAAAGQPEQGNIIGAEAPGTNSGGTVAVPKEEGGAADMAVEIGTHSIIPETAAAGQPEQGGDIIGAEAPGTNSHGTVAVPKKESKSAANMTGETGTNIPIPKTAAAGQPEQEEGIGAESPETNSNGILAVPKEEGKSAADMVAETGTNSIIPETAAAGQPEQGDITEAEAPGTNRDGTLAVQKEDGNGAEEIASETGTNVTIPNTVPAGQPEQEDSIGAETPETNSDGTLAVPKEVGKGTEEIAAETGTNITSPETAAAGQPEQGDIIGAEAPETNSDGTIAVPKEVSKGSEEIAAETGTNITSPETAAAGQPEQGDIIGAEAPGTNSNGTIAAPNEEGNSDADIAAETGTNFTIAATKATIYPVPKLDETVNVDEPNVVTVLQTTIKASNTNKTKNNYSGKKSEYKSFERNAIIVMICSVIGITVFGGLILYCHYKINLADKNQRFQPPARGGDEEDGHFRSKTYKKQERSRSLRKDRYVDRKHERFYSPKKDSYEDKEHKRFRSPKQGTDKHHDHFRSPSPHYHHGDRDHKRFRSPSPYGIGSKHKNYGLKRQYSYGDRAPLLKKRP